MPARAQQIPDKHPTEVEVGIVDFGPKLRSGELLTGAATVVVSPSGPTLGSPSITTTDITIEGVTVTTGEGITFTVSGGTAETDYDITATCGTDGTPARTLVVICPLRVTVK